MSTPTPTVVLVHGAFAESASWNDVIGELYQKGVTSVAVANPLRSVSVDAAYLRDVLDSIEGPVVLAGHSYGGFVITEAGAHPAVKAIVYVSAFAPAQGETAFELSTKFPGSTLGDALTAYPVSTGGNEFAIRRDVFRQQFAADVDVQTAGRMGATQRPVTEKALTEPLPTTAPAWTTRPSWFVYGELDLNIPAELQRFQVERAGARGAREIPGASHALSVSQPQAVADTILEAVAAIS
ncbi:alpha/beta hydrolase [Protaetiibacter sp. SSC-01]|uniref:alpha/beta fold hydrolase n=1 Tax=Protaetiibacter sp. SSC-01 TaxID=2759943 RepID=UPI0016575EF3|nr:alpha/beta hydrolase [Protaetiibacter sp. SSC-01]QNO38110.1 alpha/beta hydrolase [Protaetiibacter sp. SSC-01]